MQLTIGFVGIGNMAYALAKGLGGRWPIIGLASPRVGPSLSRDRWAREFPLIYDQSLFRPEIVILAVKPQQLKTVPEVPGVKLTLSVLAGVSVARLREAGWPGVVRLMPNLSVQSGESIFLAEQDSFKEATIDHQVLLKRIFSCWGEPLFVPEGDFHRLTSVVGSGVAQLAVLAGLWERHYGLSPAQVNRLLVSQAKILGDDFSETIKRVASPGGVTEAMVQEWQLNGVEQKWVSGLKAAEARSRELGEM